jgi:hypothetical protein
MKLQRLQKLRLRRAGWLLLPMIGVAVTMMVPVGKDTAF